MTIEEAMKLAKETEDNGFLNKYPQATITLRNALVELAQEYANVVAEHEKQLDNLALSITKMEETLSA